MNEPTISATQPMYCSLCRAEGRVLTEAKVELIKDEVIVTCPVCNARYTSSIKELTEG